MTPFGQARVALVALVSVLASCAGRSGPERLEAVEIRIEVDNANYLDVVVFGLQDHTATRIGTVSGLMSATFSIPHHLVVLGRVRILVDPVGSPVAYLTDEIMVNPGETIELRVAGRIRMSSWSVRGSGGAS